VARGDEVGPHAEPEALALQDGTIVRGDDPEGLEEAAGDWL